MNVLVNFGTLKGGGGQNVGLNFLNALAGTEKNGIEFFFMVAESSSIRTLLQKSGKYPYVVVPDHPLRRMYFERFRSGRILKEYSIDLIYSYFGYGLFPKTVRQVCGAADSNLFFPQIDFWAGYKGLARLKREWTDKFRISGLKKADGIIFENELLEQKCHELFSIKGMTTTIRPSISLDYPSSSCELPQVIRQKRKGLFLCGWHRNKNILLIPRIARCLKDSGTDFHFILTAPKDNSSMHQQFTKLCNDYGVTGDITILGPVGKEKLQDLYRQTDIVFLLSKLESFSNNIIEAWNYRRVLLVADEPWAHALCHEAATYVDRDSPDAIADRISRLLSDTELYERIVKKGIEELSAYPSVQERTREELKFLKTIYEQN